jgi:hypothetical protein
MLRCSLPEVHSFQCSQERTLLHMLFTDEKLPAFSPLDPSTSCF